MAQTFQDFFFCFLLTVIQQRYRNLQVVTDTFLSYDTEICLLFYPVVHHMINLLVRCFHRQRANLLIVIRLRLCELPFCGFCICIPFYCTACLFTGRADPEYHLNLFLLSRHQRDLMLQHPAKNEQRGFGICTVFSIHDNIRSLEQGAGRCIRKCQCTCGTAELRQVTVPCINRLG